MLSAAPIVIHMYVVTFRFLLKLSGGTDELHRDNHATVSKVCEALKAHGIKPWFDSERMEHNIVDQMTNGIDDSACVAVFITSRYIDKVRSNNSNDNCKTEFNYARNQKSAKLMLAIPMEPRCMDASSWKGAVGATLGSELYHANFAFDIDEEPAKFRDNVKILAERIKTLTARV